MSESTMNPHITYGLSCKRTPTRTAALRALIYAVRAHKALSEVSGDGSAWDLALTGEKVHTSAAVDACRRVCSSVLPPGQIGGLLLLAALQGEVPGLDVP